MDSDRNGNVPFEIVRKLDKLLSEFEKVLNMYQKYINKRNDQLPCPFNKAHLIPKYEYFHHTRTCTDRSLITHNLQSAPDNTKRFKMESAENAKYFAGQPNGIFPSPRNAFVKIECTAFVKNKCNAVVKKEPKLEESDGEDDKNEAKAAPSKVKTSKGTSHRSAPY